MSSAADVRRILAEHGFRFSKSMGQNFLIDANIPEKIVRLATLDKTCGVLEIGPGIGALTFELSRAAGFVTAVELDRRLLPILYDVLVDRNNVEIVQGDILKQDLDILLSEKMPGFRHHACANLPYSITTPALTALIDAGVFETITVMVQREVARRICAKHGSPDYSAFSVYVGYHCEAEILFDVSPECFFPKPGVWSSVLKLKTRKGPLLEAEIEKVFFRLVKAAFGQRRKTLANALHSAFGSSMSKEDITAIVEDCGFDPLVRGETLSIAEFSALAHRFLSLL